MKQRAGFSLVELIVVVAIMAVLIGVLAPTYLAYVEKTRCGVDEKDAEEIRKATETIILSGSYEVEEAVVVKFSKNGIEVVTSDYSDALEEELKDIFPNFPSVVPKSKKYQDAVYSVSLTEEVATNFVVEGNWSFN